MANDSNVTDVIGEVEEAARRMIPGRGSGVDSVTSGTSGMGGRPVTLTAGDGEGHDRARGVGADGVVGHGRAARDVLDLPTDAPFPVARRREFVEPEFVTKGGNPDSDYAPLVDFIPAAEVAAVGRFIAAKYRARLPHLFPPFDQRVDYLWKRAGGESAGRAVLGKCVKSGSLARYYARLADPKATWTIWVAADHCEGITAHQMHALVLHELLHTSMTLKLKPKIQGHNLEEFRLVIQEYGFWDDDLRALKETVQMRLRLDGDEDEESD